LCAGPRSGSVVILDGRPWLVGAGTGDVPALMESDDGLSWANHGERLGDVFPDHAAVDATGMVVFARAPDGSALVLRSADGRRFTSEPLTGEAGAPVEVVAAVTSGPLVRAFATEGDRVRMLTPKEAGGWMDEPVGGIAASWVQGIRLIDGQLIAFEVNPNGGHMSVWASRTGTEWRPLVMPGALGNDTEVLDLAAANGVAVVVGRVPAPDGSGTIGAMWTGPSTLLTN
jgi:hypothetical protein